MNATDQEPVDHAARIIALADSPEMFSDSWEFDRLNATTAACCPNCPNSSHTIARHAPAPTPARAEHHP